MPDLITFAKQGALGRKDHLKAVDDQPSIYWDRCPFAHLEAVTRPDGSTLILNHEKDTAQAFKPKRDWCGND